MRCPESKRGITKLYSIIAVHAIVPFISASAVASQSPAKQAGAATVDSGGISLDGADWTLTSIAPGEGEKNSAFAESFDDRDARKVTVPGEVQPQLGLKGSELFQESGICKPGHNGLVALVGDLECNGNYPSKNRGNAEHTHSGGVRGHSVQAISYNHTEGENCGRYRRW